MSTWLTLDYANCEDVGLHVLGYPPRKVVPRRSARQDNVPGGMTVWTYKGRYGYEDMMLPVTFYWDGVGDGEDAAAFLMPDSRDIVFGDQPEYVYRGRVDEQTDFESIFRERRPCRFTVNFICRPVRGLSSPGAALVFEGDGVIAHPGNARSYPLILAEGEGDGVISIGGQQIAITGLAADAPISIDCQAMICTDEAGETDLSALADGDYPYLDPGDNAISFTGGITRLIIAPRLWWLGR